MELKNNFVLKKDYQNGLIGWISMMHGQSYKDKWNFGKYFESKVATQLSSFLESYDPDRSCIFSLMKDGKFYGSISIDGSHAEQDGAHLRWFILHEKAKGMGFGRLLLNSTIEFAKEKNFPSIYLWTLEGLEPAGTLYRSAGFELEESLVGSQWGQAIKEEKLRLTL